MVGEAVGDQLRVALDPDPDHGLSVEPDLQGIGDRHDLHHLAVQQALHALPDGGLGQADALGDVA